MINQVVVEIIHTWAETVAERINNRWNNISIPGEAEIDVSNIQTNGLSLVQAIEAFGQKAWITEFGSGSEADTMDNPYIDDYINSPNFNRYRRKYDMAIRGRDAGTYYDLDGNKQSSTGSNAGKDLELKPVYPGMTMLPMHVIREEIEAAYESELVPAMTQGVKIYIVSQLTMGLKTYT